MSLITELIERADWFASKRGWKRSTVSKRILGSGTNLDELANGKEIGVRRYERVVEELKGLELEHGVSWPPTPSEAAAASDTGPSDADTAKPECSGGPTTAAPVSPFMLQDLEKVT